jgi:8-oxo-dGTP pyrophosphatase MutT (NUDIX family)
MSFYIRYYSNRIFWFFARPIRKWYRFMARPTGRAVKVLIHDDNQVLLVLPGYGHREWSVPGGGVDGRETFEEAARREISEELNMQIDTLEYLGEYYHELDYQVSLTKVFATSPRHKEFNIDGIEIVNAAWFPLEKLPPKRRPRVDEILAMLTTKKDP